MTAPQAIDHALGFQPAVGNPCGDAEWQKWWCKESATLLCRVIGQAETSYSRWSGVVLLWQPISDTVLSQDQIWQEPPLPAQVGQLRLDACFSMGKAWLLRYGNLSSEYLFEGSRHPARLHLPAEEEKLRQTLMQLQPDFIGLGVPPRV